MTGIELVKRGFFVLPLRENGKEPNTKHGVRDAQNSVEFVRTFMPKGNIGIACNNVLVIDVDVKSGDGIAELKLMEEELGELNPKGKVVTPSGGWHLYFRNPNCEISGQTHIKFHDKPTQIDIRTDGQYVVAPPSVINGNSYEWEIEPVSVDELSELPEKWIEFLPKRGVQQKLDSPLFEVSIAPEDVRYIQERCWKYLSKEIRPAVQGQGGQRQMFTTMNVIFNGFALSKQDGYPVLARYNECCQPPWDLNSPGDAKWIDSAIDRVIATAETRGDILNAVRKEDNLAGIDPEFLLKLFSKKVEAKPKQAKKKTKVNRWAKDYVPQDNRVIDDNMISEEFMNIPGFINEYLELVQKTSIAYNKYACFAGALALLSLLAGPRFHYEQTRANLYLVALARSGDGKNVAREINKHILDSIGKSVHQGQNFVSGEAIEDAILQYGRMLFQVDESDIIFTSIAQGKESYQRSIQANLLGMYTDASSSWIARKKAAGAKQVGQVIPQVYNPYLVLLCTAPPKNYYSSLSERIAEGGLFARLVIFKALEYEIHPENKNNFQEHPICKKLIDFARLLFSIKFDSEDNIEFIGRTGPVRAIAMNQTPGAREIFSEFAVRASKLKDEVGEDEAQRSLLGRANENAKKYAMLYEISRKMDILLNCKDTYGDPDVERITDALLIDEEIADWATRFSGNIVDVQTEDFNRYFYENEHEKLNNDILAFIRRGTRGNIGAVLKSQLWCKFSKYEKREIDGSLYSLISQNKIRELPNFDAEGNPAWMAIEEE